MPEQLSNNKRIAKNTIMLYIRMLLSVVVSLYTSRVVLEVLGVEDYGLYGLVGGVVTMFSFLNSTMAGATSRFLTFEMGRGDQDRLKATFSSALIIHIGIALLVLILAETVGLWFLNNKLVIPEGRMHAAHWVLQFSVISMLVNFTQVPYNAAIIAHEKMDIYAYVELLNVFLKLGIVYLLTIGNFDKLILYAFLVLVVSVLIAFIYRFYCIRHYEECHFRFVWDKGIMLPMLSFSAYDLYGNMCYTARLQGTNFLLNMFFGTVINAANSISSVIQSTLLTISSTVVTAFKPQIIKNYAAEDSSGFNYYIKYGANISSMLLTVVTIPLIINLPQVLTLWLGQVPEGVLVISRILLVANFFTVQSQILNVGIHATGKVKWLGLISGSVYLLSLPVMYLLLKLGLGYNYIYMIVAMITFLNMIVAWGVLRYNTQSFELKKYIIRTFIPQLIIALCAYFATLYIIHDISSIKLFNFILDFIFSAFINTSLKI